MSKSYPQEDQVLSGNQNREKIMSRKEINNITPGENLKLEMNLERKTRCQRGYCLPCKNNFR
jgi:hypothetical protein